MSLRQGHSGRDHGKGKRSRKHWSWVVGCFIGCLCVVDTKEGFIKQGFIASNWMVKAYRDKEPIRNLRVAVNSVGLWGVEKHSGLVKVLL
jgi:hypothetical protein